MRKMILPIFATFMVFLGGAQANSEEQIFKQNVLKKVSQIPGWCSQKKAEAMMDLIFEVKPNVCVEIGVFGGASLFPTASTLKFLRQGMLFAIDPWDMNECTKYFPAGDPNKIWWENLDLDSIYLSCLDLIKTNHLKKYCTVFKSTSEQAASKIGQIDILHIDGNHCDTASLIDVSLYLPKVKVGGYIWFDGWSTSPQAFELVKETCYVRKIIDAGTCILLEKVLSSESN